MAAGSPAAATAVSWTGKSGPCACRAGSSCTMMPAMRSAPRRRSSILQAGPPPAMRPVEGEGESSRFRAEGFRVLDGGNRIRLVGNSVVRFDSAPGCAAPMKRAAVRRNSASGRRGGVGLRTRPCDRVGRAVPDRGQPKHRVAPGRKGLYRGGERPRRTGRARAAFADADRPLPVGRGREDANRAGRGAGRRDDRPLRTGRRMAMRRSMTSTDRSSWFAAATFGSGPRNTG